MLLHWARKPKRFLPENENLSRLERALAGRSASFWKNPSVQPEALPSQRALNRAGAKSKRFGVSGLGTRSVRRGLEEALRPGQPLGLKRSPVTGFLGRKRFVGNESSPLTLQLPIFPFRRLKGQPGRALRSFSRRRSASFFQPTGPEALPAGAPGKSLAWFSGGNRRSASSVQRVGPGI